MQTERAVVESLAHFGDEAHEGRLGADVDDAGLGVGGAVAVAGGGRVGEGVAVDRALVNL